MVNKRLMWVAICTRFSHPGIIIDVLSDLCTGAIINISVEVLVIDVEMFVVVALTAIDFDFVMSVSYTVGVLVGVWLDTLNAVDSGDVTTVTLSGIGVDMLAGVDADAFAAGMADLKFIVSTPLTDSVPFC